MKTKVTALTRSVSAAVVLGTISFCSQAEVTLLKQDPQAGDPLSRLNISVGGSIRPQLLNMNGTRDYKRNVYDGSSRMHVAADYYLSDDVSWVGYYEIGVNFPRMFKWDNHYKDTGTSRDAPTTHRMLYTGFKSDKWGTLTFGQQKGVYYDVVAVRTDIWDYDQLAQASGNGINADYDGSYRGRKQLKYKKTIGDVDLYAAYMMNDQLNRNDGNGYYRRKGGGSLGVDYRITPDLSVGAAWQYVKAELKGYDGHDNKTYNQSIWGVGTTWTPGRWTTAAILGWYQNFMQLKSGYTPKKINNQNAFADDVWGYEYYVGYSFPIDRYAVKSIQPYVMGDRLEYVNGSNWKRIDNGVGVNFQFDYGFSVQYEHVLTSSTDKNLGDVNLVRLRYDF
ncbi:outer membrane protein [Salmonella enterica subsp. enterica serovar Choleraesuis]|nr:outer membrane protein [Salmonella enterica subsp. enterica serovar Choleraesuis]